MKEGDTRIPSGCAISGIMNRKGHLFSGTDIVDSIATMHERSNGLGGGFAAYGIYPEFKDSYALHMFIDDLAAKEVLDNIISRQFVVEHQENIPTRKVAAIEERPLLWRYFVTPASRQLEEFKGTEDEYVARFVMNVNYSVRGAFVASSGKNMGAFKAVAYPEDAGEFYRLDEYKGYLWTAHGRFPTNTPGWWGGAHPFTLLDWAVVHNGEISSYDANRRFLEMYDYQCALQTDTEVITYLFDLLIRKHGLALKDAVTVVAPPFWKTIEQESHQEQQRLTTLRQVYSSALLNGPFSIIVSTRNGMMALNDRIKLRPMTAAERGDYLYVASEEAAIRVIVSQPDRVWSPRGGEAVIGLLDGASDLMPADWAQSTRTVPALS